MVKEIPVETSSMGIIIGQENNSKKVTLLKDDEGNWVLPKGHIEAGETDIEAAIREVREETGIEVGQNQCLGQIDEFEYYFKAKNINKIIKVFLFSIDSFENINFNKEEGFIAGKWFELEKVENLLHHNDAKEAVKKAIKKLNRQV